MSQPADTVHRIVVVGGGLAGARSVEELRDRGFEGDLTLVGAEPHLPYDRPQLSKEVLLGTAEPESAFLHDRQWYDDHGVDVRPGAAATGLDLAARVVEVGTDRLGYDRLLLATGSQPRRLALFDDSGLDAVTLRTLDDTRLLRDRLAGQLLIVGAGWIGLEVASAARQAGADVTVVEGAPQPLLNVLGPDLAPLFADLHRSHGVDLRLGTTIDRLDGDKVVLSDGTRLRPDLVVVGIGAVPRVGLAEAAGLATDHGILVDARLRTSDPHVFAAGDVANQDHPTLGRLRVEHWDNAAEQGRHAARAMLGDPAAYSRMPFFYSDQYDLGLEYVGHVGADGYDEIVVRGDRDTRVFHALWVKDSRVVAGLQVNDWNATEQIRELLAAGEVDVEALRRG